tara:strand:- start:257 stop:850 length:594 start_codon:yes stop_codon:yes gene_type:complete
MAFNPVSTGASLAVAVNGSSVTTGSFEQHKSDTLRVTSNVDSLVAVGIGSTNAASAGSVFIKGGETVNINTGRPSSNRVTGITTSGTNTTVTFAEGTGCPFYVGQLITVRTNSVPDKHWEFANKIITSIDTTANVASTQITVANDYGIGAGATAFTQSNTISNTEARADLVVSCKGAAANAQLGALYYQQVQVSGDA